MTALTKDRNTIRRLGELHVDPVGASANIRAGALLVLNAAGFVVPGSTATGLTVRGRADEAVDNSAGADGDVTAQSSKGTFQFVNDGSINRTHIGGTAYIVDDQTVAATDGTGTRSAGGVIDDVDADGVWVQI
jgi:hypothetical protein